MIQNRKQRTTKSSSKSSRYTLDMSGDATTPPALPPLTLEEGNTSRNIKEPSAQSGTSVNIQQPTSQQSNAPSNINLQSPPHLYGTSPNQKQHQHHRSPLHVESGDFTQEYPATDMLCQLADQIRGSQKGQQVKKQEKETSSEST